MLCEVCVNRGIADHKVLLCHFRILGFDFSVGASREQKSHLESSMNLTDQKGLHRSKSKCTHPSYKQQFPLAQYCVHATLVVPFVFSCQP